MSAGVPPCGTRKLFPHQPEGSQIVKFSEMKTNVLRIGIVIALNAAVSAVFSQTALTSNPYRVLKTTQTMGTGGIDYVHADNENRRLYVHGRSGAGF